MRHNKRRRDEDDLLTAPSVVGVLYFTVRYNACNDSHTYIRTYGIRLQQEIRDVRNRMMKYLASEHIINILEDYENKV